MPLGEEATKFLLTALNIEIEGGKDFLDMQVDGKAFHHLLYRCKILTFKDIAMKTKTFNNQRIKANKNVPCKWLSISVKQCKIINFKKALQ